MALTRPSKLISSDISGSFNKSAVSASFAASAAVSASFAKKGAVSGSFPLKSAISGSFVNKADKSAISGSVASGFEFDGSISGSSTSTGSFGHVTVDGVLKTGDLELENKRGHWKIVEESEYLSITNVNTNKKYKILMEEIE